MTTNGSSGSGWMIALGALAVCVFAAGVAALVLRSRDAGTVSDVGGLAALADVQARLRPLDVCVIRYGHIDRRHHSSGFGESLFATACSHGSYDDVTLGSPRNYLSDHVAFRLERDGRDRPFRVLVDKEATPFPALQQALGEIVPVFEARYDAALAEIRRHMADPEQTEQARRAREAARKAASEGSYPAE